MCGPFLFPFIAVIKGETFLFLISYTFIYVLVIAPGFTIYTFNLS